MWYNYVHLSALRYNTWYLFSKYIQIFRSSVFLILPRTGRNMKRLLLCIGFLILLNFDLSITVQDKQSVKDFVEKFFTDFCNMNDPETYFTQNAYTSWAGVEVILDYIIQDYFKELKFDSTCYFPALSFISFQDRIPINSQCPASFGRRIYEFFRMYCWWIQWMWFFVLDLHLQI